MYKKTILLKAIVLLFISIFLAMEAEPDPLAIVQVSWNPNDEEDLGGYKVHYGTELGVYPGCIDVGKTTKVYISGFLPGVTYHFVVSAYDTVGNESEFSAVSSLAIPGTAPSPIPVPQPKIFDDSYEFTGYISSPSPNMIQADISASDIGANKTFMDFNEYTLEEGDVVRYTIRGYFISYTSNPFAHIPVYLVDTSTGKRISSEFDMILNPEERTIEIPLRVMQSTANVKLHFEFGLQAGLINLTDPETFVDVDAAGESISSIGISNLEKSNNIAAKYAAKVGWAQVMGASSYRVVDGYSPNWDESDPYRQVIADIETVDNFYLLDILSDSSGNYRGRYITVYPIFTLFGIDFYGDPVTISYLPGDISLPFDQLNYQKAVDITDVSLASNKNNQGKSLAGIFFALLNLIDTYADNWTRPTDITFISYQRSKSAKMNLYPVQ